MGITGPLPLDVPQVFLHSAGSRAAVITHDFLVAIRLVDEVQIGLPLKAKQKSRRRS